MTRILKRLALAVALTITLVSPATLADEPQSAQTPKVNINTADAAALAEQLSGIGQARAEAIIAFRKAEGDFVTIEHLEEVPGIGMTTVENNRDRLTVD